MLREILTMLADAALAVPGVRFLLGLVDSRLRPLWAAVLIGALLYLISRTSNFVSLQRARRIVLAEDLEESKDNDDSEATVARSAPAVAASPPGVSSQRLLGAVIAGISGIVLVAIVALRLGAPREQVATGVVESVPNEPADTSFTFGAAGWRNDRGTCIATMQVTALGRRPYRLSLFVMNAAGTVIGRDEIDKPLLAAGAMIDFRFRRLDCDDIHEWQVRGEFPKP